MKLNDRKKSTKTGKNFRGGEGDFSWLARIYTPENRSRFPNFSILKKRLKRYGGMSKLMVTIL